MSETTPIQEETPRRRRPRETEPPVDSKTTIWASLGMTINLGNFESQKIDVGVSGIPVDASPEYVQQQLDKSIDTIKMAIESLAKELGRRLTEDYGR